MNDMLCAKRKSDGREAFAFSESKANAPFICPECDQEVYLRAGSVRVNHFAHKNPDACSFATGESDEHRRCKMEIYEALVKAPNVAGAALERPLGTNRPDVFAFINGVPVAIEVQLSALSLDTIIRRTEEYARKGIYVLWLPQWTPYLDGVRYSPRLWEKWIHAAYFGRVYYWLGGLSVASYRFESFLKHVPRTRWNAAGGVEITAGGYTHRSKRHRSPIRGEMLNLATDFAPRKRERWKGGSFIIPSANLFMPRVQE